MKSTRLPDAPRPFVVAVQGLKNSGKTTAAVALIADLAARGFKVAAVKTSHLADLDLDPEGRDSRQLYEAGAACVIAQGQRQTLIVRRHDRPAPFGELLALLPPGTDFVVAEGGSGLSARAQGVFVCLRSLEELGETLRVRQVPAARVLALTGLAAAGPPAPGPVPLPQDAAAAAEAPLLNAADPAGRQALVELVLAAAATSSPRTS